MDGWIRECMGRRVSGFACNVWEDGYVNGWVGGWVGWCMNLRAGGWMNTGMGMLMNEWA